MAKIKSYLERCVKEGVFPGASWAIGNADEIFEIGSVGVLGHGLEGFSLLGTDLGPVEQNSIYDMASLTKIFVALAFMKQLEDGLVRLEDTVDYFLPAYKNCPFGAVSLFALLTHTALFPGGTSLYRQVKTREELLEALRLYKFRTDNTDKVIYTCEAFILLGEVISAVDSASLDEIIRKRVTVPLEMKDTCYNPPAELLPRIAPTEFCSIRKRIVRGEVHDENAMIMGGVSGNAGIFSCAPDMARIGTAMLASLNSADFQRKARSPQKTTFLQKVTAELMCKNHTPGKGENRGLGWMIAEPGCSAGDLLSSNSFGHTGFTGTSLWIDPDRKIYALLLSNRVHPTRDNQKMPRTRQIFHNLAVVEYGDSRRNSAENPPEAKQGSNG
jgi:CubicO group peptidase (beta-lactamase class C family)